MTLFSFAYLISSFFSRARTASTFSALIYLGLTFALCVSHPCLLVLAN